MRQIARFSDHKTGRTSETSRSERIRVLWLIKGLGRGGAERLLCDAAELGDHERFGYEAAYFLGERNWLADELRSKGVPVHLFATTGRFDFGWVRALRKFLLRERFQVVHVHSPLIAAATRLVVSTLPRRMRPALMSTEHLPWSGYRLPTRIVNGATFPLDRTHLAVSNAVRGSIPRPLRRNVTVLNHGVPSDRIRSLRVVRNQVRRELGIRDDEILVGTVANFTKQKAHQDLIGAAALVVNRGRNVRFATVGRGPTEPSMRALAEKLGVSQRFLFLGPQDDGPRFIAAFDVFALSSHYEGLPLVIMEALTLGVPVVATRVDGILELIEDGVDGLLVPPSRPDLLANALDTLIVDAERRAAFGAAGLERAAAFDNRPAVSAIESTYRQLALSTTVASDIGRSDRS